MTNKLHETLVDARLLASKRATKMATVNQAFVLRAVAAKEAAQLHGADLCFRYNLKRLKVCLWCGCWVPQVLILMASFVGV
jgi:hypothetical protein